MALALLAILSCKKEMVEPQTKMSLPQLSTGNLLDYEYYTPAGDVETEIRAALLALENDDNLGYTSINRGVWLLETGLNYLLPDSSYLFDDYFLAETTTSLSIAETGLLSEADLKSLLVSHYNVITSEISADKKHVATDIKVKEINATSMVIAIQTTYLLQTSVGALPLNCQLGNTTTPKVAGYSYYCPYLPGNSASRGAWGDAALNARYCLRNYNGPDWSAKYPKYYTNVIDYSSNPNLYSNLAIPFSSDNLLGQPSAPLSAHQIPVPSATCLSAAEQNAYVPVIYNDVSNLIVKDKGVIYLKIVSENSTYGNPGITSAKWWYAQIKIGTNGFYPLYGQPLSLSQIL